ncbi:Mitochondrial matrix iron chaperone [Umbelopsis sp. WA50703]
MNNIRFAARACRLATRAIPKSQYTTVTRTSLQFGTKVLRSHSERPSFNISAMPTQFYSQRSYTTQTYTAAQLTPGEYHKASDLTLESILDVLETIGDEHDIDNYDVEYSQGVLTLKLGAKGTYVLNKQPPNQQIWLSSPKSGPKRYDYDAEHIKWFYARDNHTIDELLNEELTEALGFDVKLLE